MCDERRAVVDLLNAENVALKETIAELKKERESWQEGAEQEARHNEALKERVAELKKERGLQHASADRWRQACGDADADRDSLRKQVKELGQELHASACRNVEAGLRLGGERDSLRKQVEELEKERDDPIAANEGVKTERDVYKAQLASLRKQVECLKGGE